MEELIKVSGTDEAALRASTGAKAASFLSMTVVLGVILWTGGSEIFMPPTRPILMGQEAAADKAAKNNRSFWDGSLARSFETNFRLRGHVRRKFGPYWSMAMLKLGDVTSSELILGKDEWLFLRGRVRLQPEMTAEGRVVFPNIMGALSRTLAAHGTTLVNLPLLRKGVACEERLPDGLDPDVGLDREIIDSLKARGVLTVDIFDKWRSMEPHDVYKIQDTHWARPARIEVIKELARTVPEIPQQEVGAWHTYGEDKFNAGLLNFLGIAIQHPVAAQARAVPEKGIKLFPLSFAAELEAGTYPSRILHVGTSFSAGFQFRDLLAALLRVGVDDASEFGQPILSSLQAALEDRFDHLPEFMLAEFPLYQAAKMTRLTPFANEFGGVVFGRLNERLEFSAVPEELIEPPTSNTSSDGLIAWSYRKGSLVSSGDGVLLLELEFNGPEPSEWALSMGGARWPISVPAGSQRRVLPLVDGPVVGDFVTLLPKGILPSSQPVNVRVVADVDLGAARSMSGALGAAATWESSETLSVERFDALTVRWSEKTAAPLDVIAIGVDAKGAPAEQRWTTPESPGSRFGVFTLGAFIGGEVTSVRVGGVAGEVQVSVASKPK